MTTVFFIGATGCIGGSVLVALQKAHPTFKFKALARKEAVIDAFNKAAGPNDAKVVAVKGSFDDSELIARLTYEADIVVNAADADHVGLRDALLKGFKKRVDDGKPLGAYLHTSGTAIFMDGTKEGKPNPDGKVWTDDESDIRQLTETMLHGQFDVPLLKAQENGYLNAYIICPAGVHGIGGGPLKRPSVAFMIFLAECRESKRVRYIGEGTNGFGWVHVDDLVPLYVTAFQRLIDADGKKLAGSPYERYVIATRQWLEIRTWLGIFAAELYKLGKLDSPEMISIPYAEASPMGALLLAQNAPCRVGRAYSLGWKTSSDYPTLYETLPDDVRAIVAA
ncbi:hypothetical protein PHLGIDRAFT_15544 [Phlebiopsis gigantea 11061_1 CR5-6]|uniref:NAD-dependent epimerase/dehydratase domain-containing protein n=1 Tax=Phlebiopsis gigantea (strain 11061_1 CR5-6) TaxID=745531 RepID=A0A0C3S668_PHLG1|nr:hypothetical protein PHLGIDRAFT_15544 [Phlebiopsis gigantea 11061_1 CR5-6]